MRHARAHGPYSLMAACTCVYTLGIGEQKYHRLRLGASPLDRFVCRHRTNARGRSPTAKTNKDRQPTIDRSGIVRMATVLVGVSGFSIVNSTTRRGHAATRRQRSSQTDRSLRPRRASKTRFDVTIDGNGQALRFVTIVYFAQFIQRPSQHH